MIDPFVILAPVLLLAVIALLRFVGCDPFGTAPDLPQPTISSLVPTSKTEGDPDFSLTVKGTGFVNPGSVVRWNGVDKATTFVSDAELTATITAGDIANAGTAQVTVFNPPDNQTSNAQTFTIVAAPTISVTFDTPPPPGIPRDPIPAPYKNLRFSSAWIWLDAAAGGGPSNSVVINNAPPGVVSGDVTFVNGPRLLKRLRVLPKSLDPATNVANITITGGTNAKVSKDFGPGDIGTVQIVDIPWTSPASIFTAQTNIGYDLLLLEIDYRGPA